MSLGYFLHRNECIDVIPSTKEFAIIRASYGAVADSNFVTHWKEAKCIRKLAYCSAYVDPKTDVFANASKFVEAIQILQATEGQYWRDQPLVVNILNPAIDLLWIQTFVNYMHQADGMLMSSSPRILLFTTKKKWDAIQIETPEGNNMLENIRKLAEVFISDYDNKEPLLSVSMGLVCYREYKQGFVEYSDTGKFTVPGGNYVADPAIPENNDPTPEAGGFIHLQCPHCGKTIF